MRTSLLLIFVAGTLMSCSEYQKMLKSEDVLEKYTYAQELYADGKYKKALGIMEFVNQKLICVFDKDHVI